MDPFAGSYFVENLTDQIETGAQGLIDKVDELGGSVQCIPFIRAEVEESAWGYEERYRLKQDIVVGVNDYVTDSVDEVEILRVDPESERQQVERLKAFKADRDQGAVDARLEELRADLHGRRQPARAHSRGAQGPRQHRRGVRRDARGVRGVLRGLRPRGGRSASACGPGGPLAGGRLGARPAGHSARWSALGIRRQVKVTACSSGVSPAPRASARRRTGDSGMSSGVPWTAVPRPRRFATVRPAPTGCQDPGSTATRAPPGRSSAAASSNAGASAPS